MGIKNITKLKDWLKEMKIYLYDSENILNFSVNVLKVNSAGEFYVSMILKYQLGIFKNEYMKNNIFVSLIPLNNKKYDAIKKYLKLTK